MTVMLLRGLDVLDWCDVCKVRRAEFRTRPHLDGGGPFQNFCRECVPEWVLEIVRQLDAEGL